MITPRIDAQTLAQAEQQVRQRESAWEHYGRRIVTDDELAKVQADLKPVRNELHKLYSLIWTVAKLKLIMHQAIQITGVDRWGWFVEGLIVGTISVALAVVPMVVLFKQPAPVFLGLGLSFLLGSSIASVILLNLSYKDIVYEIEYLLAQLEARQKPIAELSEIEQSLENHLKVLQGIRITYE